MPIYEYRCEQGHTFEVLQRMSDEPVQTCDTCAAPVARVFHAPAVHFKGSGFYNTDYGTRKRQRESADGHKGEGSSGSSSSSDSGSSGSDSSSSDSKSSSGSTKSESKSTASKTSD
jgi:putative FmdB family regulatory protein